MLRCSPVSRLLVTMLAFAVLLAAMGSASVSSANAAGPNVTPANISASVSGVVRFDPHLYMRAGNQRPLALNPGLLPNVTNVDTTNDPQPQNETSIDISPTKPKVAVGGENDYRTNPSGDVNCGYTRTLDGGATWTSNYLKGVTKNNGGPFDYDAAGDPSLYYADNGTIYYACLAFDRSYARSAILLDASTDNGTTWFTPVAVSQSNTIDLFNDKDMLTIDNGSGSPFHGRLYVEWTQYINNLSSSQVVISHSTDRGRTWSTPLILSGTQSSVQGASPTVTPDGTVYASWCSGPTECDAGVAASTTYVARSTDGGITWTAPIAADNFTSLPANLPGNLFRVNSFPTIAVNPTNGYVYLAHAAWSTDADMTFLFSADGGNTWSIPNTLQPSTDNQFFQWMRVSASGQVWVCYYDQHWNTMHYLDMSCNSSMNGKLWTGGKRATTQSSNPANDGFGGAFIGDYNGLALDRLGNPHPLWTDTRTGNADAFVAGR